MEQDFYQLAADYDLDVVNTTAARNGYPEQIRTALTSFDNFERAKQIAERENLRLVWIDKRDGQQLWHRGNSAYEPMTITADDYGEDWHMYYSEAEWLEDRKRQLKEDVEWLSPEALPLYVFQWLEETNDISDRAENLNDREAIIYNSANRECHIVKYETINFYNDTKTITLAAI
ncbi:MAG: hypothetical protein IJS19_00305 [Muribaculaceae bacterium]|nr:hypothetical protein [Muribaculaceae bacterium]